LTPASTTKLITAATALQVLGPQTRITTRAALVPGDSTVVLVGGGDPTLLRKGRRGEAAASMSSLAAATAASLRQQGISKVRVAYDD
jgi:D-alanyl-D-alanine carboxypeptidase/D-alanyl-D-alanine-endopeptidase (penicillin-binding protein 4)